MFGRAALCAAARLMDWLTDPWQFEFMRRALLAGVIVSVAASVVGPFVVRKGLAFLGDAVAHTQLAGAAVALVLGGGALMITFGAGVAAVLTALGVALLTMRARIRADTAIGLMFAGFFALGVVLISRQRTFALDLGSLLVGNILGAGTSDLIAMGVLAGVIVLLGALFFHELRFVAYDPEMASVSGVPVTVVQVGLLVLVALAAVVAFRLVGILLAVAVLVAPATTATLLTRRLLSSMVLTGLVGIVATVIGLYLSYHANLAAGPSIVLVSVLTVALAFVASPRGLLRSLRRERRMPSEHHKPG